LRVLKEAGLVAERREGTRRIYEPAPEGLVELRAYFEQFWSAALDAVRVRAERKETK
jgi:DNA-binding transcriptional ArsR family regulator